MRRVSITVSCDSCGLDVDEEEAGASSIKFTVRGEERELDLCDECLSGSFLQEARPVTNRRKRKKAFPCDECGETFETQRGASQHRTKIHGGKK